MTHKRDTHVIQVVRAVRELQSPDLDHLDPKFEQGVSARAISEKTGIDLQKLRPLLTTMWKESKVFRIQSEVDVPRTNRGGKEGTLKRAVSHYYVHPDLNGSTAEQAA